MSVGTCLNLSLSSVKATRTARERQTACLTLSALSSVNIWLNIDNTSDPLNSVCDYVCMQNSPKYYMQQWIQKTLNCSFMNG